MATADPNDGIPDVREHARRHVADLLSHTRGLQRVVELAEEHVASTGVSRPTTTIEPAGATNNAGGATIPSTQERAGRITDRREWFRATTVLGGAPSNGR